MKLSFGKSIASGVFRSLVTVYALFTCSLTFGQSYINNWDSIEIMPAQPLIDNPTYMYGNFIFDRETSREMHGYEVSVSYEKQLATNEYSNVHLLVFSFANKGKFIQRIPLGTVRDYKFGTGIDSNVIYITNKINKVMYLSKLTIHPNSDVEIKKITLDYPDFEEHMGIDVRISDDYIATMYHTRQLDASIYIYKKSDLTFLRKTDLKTVEIGFGDWEFVSNNTIVGKPWLPGGIVLSPVFLNVETLEEQEIPDYFNSGLDYALVKIYDKVILGKYFISGDPFVDSVNCLTAHNFLDVSQYYHHIYIDQYTGQVYTYCETTVSSTCINCGPKPQQSGWYKINPDLTWGDQVPNSVGWGTSDLAENYVGHCENWDKVMKTESSETSEYWKFLERTRHLGGGAYSSKRINDTLWFLGINELSYIVNKEAQKTTSVNNIATTSANIYPNPATNIVYIPQGTYTITDAIGKTVFSSTSMGENIDISILSPGSYFVQILHDNTIATAKLLKQ